MLDYSHHNIKSHGDIKINSSAGDIRLNTQNDKKVYINNIDIEKYKTYIDIIDIDHTFDTTQNLDPSSIKPLLQISHPILAVRHSLKLSLFEIELNIITVPNTLNIVLTFGSNSNSYGFTITEPKLGLNAYLFQHDLIFWSYSTLATNAIDINISTSSDGVLEGTITKLKVNGILEASNTYELNSIVSFN